MKPRAWYNDNDAYVCEWLRELIKAGLIADGDVDNRSIRDVQPEDLRRYTQCHFFAGIGGWSYALRLAQWPDDRPVWTGSCPCQPFSAAGKQQGFADDRHLWPEWFRLIRECRPSTIFAEQVARAIGLGWLDTVADGLEGEGYAFGASVLPACAVAAPHERERLWFVANADQFSPRQERQQRSREFCGASRDTQSNLGGSRNIPDAYGARREKRQFFGRGGSETFEEIEREAAKRIFEWAFEPDVRRLAHGIPARVAKLRALGNAIVPQVAAEFIGAYLDVSA